MHNTLQKILVFLHQAQRMRATTLKAGAGAGQGKLQVEGTADSKAGSVSQSHKSINKSEKHSPSVIMNHCKKMSFISTYNMSESLCQECTCDRYFKNPIYIRRLQFPIYMFYIRRTYNFLNICNKLECLLLLYLAITMHKYRPSLSKLKHSNPWKSMFPWISKFTIKYVLQDVNFIFLIVLRRFKVQEQINYAV